jgi:hypothetical protein
MSPDPGAVVPKTQGDGFRYPSTSGRTRGFTFTQAHTGRRRPHIMAEDTKDQEKKGGFFRKLMKMAVIGAVVAGVVQFFKRRRGSDLDDTEWQELPPPAGG